MKILVTCPPMLGMIDDFKLIFKNYGMEITAPKITQTLTEDELIEILPHHDGWIIGDDPATKKVFAAGSSGKLKAAIKWGIGVDNIDFDACRLFNIPIENTPNMFGSEVADVAIGYLIGLARETFYIHESVRQGSWVKPRGISLKNKTVAVIGFGDIGSNVVKRLMALEMKANIYDPLFNESSNQIENCNFYKWPMNIEEADFIVITCALTKSNYHLINQDILNRVKSGVRIVNVARGPLIKQSALENFLKSGKVHSAALDVFEVEPLPHDSFLKTHTRFILVSHNSSNTIEALINTSEIAIKKLNDFLRGVKN